MGLDHVNLKKIRKSFGKIPLVTSLPNLVERTSFHSHTVPGIGGPSAGCAFFLFFFFVFRKKRGA